MTTRFPIGSGAKAAMLAALGLAAAYPRQAEAQQPTPPRGQPILRTPQRPAPGRVPAPPGQRPTPGSPPTAGQPAGEDDPMKGVKQSVPEIEFKPKAPGTLVSFNLDDADLPDLVKAISNITGRRFIYGGKLRNIKATVYAPEKVTAAEAYSAFLAILENNGMTVIPQGRFLKIVETPGVVSQTTPVYGAAVPVPGEDRYITRLYRLQNVDPDSVAAVLNKFKSKDGDITVHGPGNLLIITDTGSNIQRMLRIVEDVDIGGAGDQIFVHPVRGSATEIAGKLSELLDGGTGGRGGSAGGGRILADERTNSLIITATQPDYMRLIELLKRIDPEAPGDGQIHVLPLQHAVCKELQATLSQVLGAGGPAASAPARRNVQAAQAAQGAINEEIFEGEVKLACDEATNALVVTSSMRDYAQLRQVIGRLDQPRRQVFIEAVIMDVNVGRSLDFGLGFHGGGTFDTAGEQSIFYGSSNPGQSSGPVPSSILGVPANLEALAIGVRGPEIEGADNLFGTGLSIPAFGIVMHALATDGNSNILATPHILATDGVEATISIGQNIPLQTNVGGLGALAGLAGAQGGGALGGIGALGALGGLGGLGGFSAQRQDVGTRIKVKPFVNDSDQVRLNIDEEISEAGDPQGALGAVPINKRTATTTLIVKDQQTVVIGGLMRDSITSSATKIPVLGDIPVLGALFRRTVTRTAKTNLLLVLTPYVIRSQDDLRAIFERKMQERQEFLDRYFVFNDEAEWEPPKDFSRANGLVEDIRQSMLELAERERLEEEARPRTQQYHEPTEPIQLPSIGKTAAGVSGAPAATPAPATPAARPRTPRPRTPVRRRE